MTKRMIFVLGFLGIFLSGGIAPVAGAVDESHMEKIRASKKKRVVMEIEMPVDEVAGLIRREGSRCSKDELVTVVIPAPAAIGRRMELAEGVTPSGSHWFGFFVSTKLGGVLHWPVEISAIGPSKTSATLYDVGQKQAEARKKILLSSGYFCKP